MSTKPNRGCWNCRDRKVACDRSLPTCQNCANRKKRCAGYGVRLSWPQPGDKRRSIEASQTTFLPLGEFNVGFINVTCRDIEVSLGLGTLEQGKLTGLISGERIPPYLPMPSPSSVDRSLSMGSMDLHQQGQKERLLNTVDKSIIAKMVSSDDGYFDLYHLLLRMSLCDESLPALAVRHSITSLSILHTQGPSAARSIRGKALSAIRRTIANGLTHRNEVLQVIAASLLMELYEIHSREFSSTTWTSFLCGSKKLAKLIYEYDEGYEGDIALVFDWLFYHHVMYKFTVWHWARRREGDYNLAREPPIISKELFSPMRNIILPTLGCSLELLDIFASVIDAVLDDHDPNYLSGKHQQTIRALNHKLRNIHQVERIQPSLPPDTTQTTTTTTATNNRVRDTADLFRLSIQIYLERVGNRSAANPEELKQLLDQAFTLLSSLKHVNQRFPVFVVALEARTDEQRALILRTFARTEEQRVPNELSSIRAMVEAAWVRRDLSLDGNGDGHGHGGLDALRLYNDIIGANLVPPAFT